MTNKAIYKVAVSTKAKRKALMDQVKAMATKAGAVVIEDLPNGILSDGEYMLTLGKGDYRVSMGFCGKSNVGAFLGHWFTRGEEAYPATFPAGEVNTTHYRKATTLAYTFDIFIQKLENGFNALPT